MHIPSSKWKKYLSYTYDQVMTKEGCYLWSNWNNNSIIGVSVQSTPAFLKIIYIAAFVFEFCNSILTKQNTLYKSWNASCKCTMFGVDWPAFYWHFFICGTKLLFGIACNSWLQKIEVMWMRTPCLANFRCTLELFEQNIRHRFITTD